MKLHKALISKLMKNIKKKSGSKYEEFVSYYTVEI